jgi:hypothetical protein
MPRTRTFKPSGSLLSDSISYKDIGSGKDVTTDLKGRRDKDNTVE